MFRVKYNIDNIRWKQAILSAKGVNAMSTNTLNIRPYNNKEQLLFPANVGDYLSQDHLAHVVDEAVEHIDINPFYKKIAKVGNPPYDPRMHIKLLFYGYATKICSSRKIDDKVQTDVAFIYLAGMQKPDFRTISDFRKNNVCELRTAFVEIVKLCHALGMTNLGTIAIDSTVMKASASNEQSYRDEELDKEQKEIEDAIQTYLDKVASVDESEDKLYGCNYKGDELPEGLRDKETRLKKLKDAAERLKVAKQKLKETEKERINLTDEDAQFQKSKGHVISGYRGHIAVDDKEQVIIAADVDNDGNDSRYLPIMVDQVIETLEKILGCENCANPQEPIKVLTDAGYSSGKVIDTLEKEPYKNIVDIYMPDRGLAEYDKFHDINSRFHRSKFSYDRVKDCVYCPEGNELTMAGHKTNKSVMNAVYRNTKACKQCSHRAECTSSKSGRYFLISEYQEQLNRMRSKLNTPYGQELYRKRKIIVEPVFGNMHHNLGLREFNVRKRPKVTGEFLLMCIAHNVRKIARALNRKGNSIRESLQAAALLPIQNSS